MLFFTFELGSRTTLSCEYANSQCIVIALWTRQLLFTPISLSLAFLNVLTLHPLYSLVITYSEVSVLIGGMVKTGMDSFGC